MADGIWLVNPHDSDNNNFQHQKQFDVLIPSS